MPVGYSDFQNAGSGEFRMGVRDMSENAFCEGANKKHCSG
ncbi:hypothetical protein EZS27_030226 [termite gut metagenome]|uniref:Uncharacterized protein n=1 Tax=termite gut metagenome TaxID=433724 RepID=A0A5J4QE19_9ZZZZ